MAVYRFRFETSHPSGKYSGPDVPLTVTAVQMNVVRVNLSSNEAELNCHSTCSNYVWFKSGQKVPEEAPSYTGHFNPGENISCALKGHEDYGSPSLYAPKVPSVSASPSGEILEGSSVNLTCTHDANIEVIYTWYKESQALPSKEPQLVFSSIQTSDSAEYYCTAETELGRRTSKYISINVKYPPKLPSVSVSPSDEIKEGSSVTLTCSSDANPAANYSWYKKNQTVFQGTEGIYNFTSISSEDRGIYYCKSENQYGEIKSSNIFLDVQYAPKLPSVSVSPSAEIEEGSSVTLTCSSDANPAANYTWYKENQTLFRVTEGSYNFTSITFKDRGIYYCKSENQYGEIRSRPTCIDVQYAPELPSVSVEMVMGSSVTLTCSSDANPAANYTWYKEDEDSPKASGQIFTITDFRAEHSGSYYCVAQNRRGSRSSTLHLIVASELCNNLAGTVLATPAPDAPKPPSVSVSPSAEIEEGSSVTLTCSSDANPAANYTWYKENEDSPKASGQIFNITDFRAEHSGSYSCGAQNTISNRNSTFHLILVAGSSTILVNIIRTTLGVLMLIPVFLLSLWMRKKKALRSTTEAHEPVEIELDSGFMCENFSETAAETEDTEEQEDMRRIGGGFGSTQSTMVVLQALSEYLIHKPPPADLSLDVDVRLRGRKEIRYHFNPENSYAARSSRLHAGMDLEVQAQGNGQGILEVVTYYNQLHEVDEKIPCKDFELKFNIEESNETPPVDVQKSYQITIKVRALGPTDVRMVVLDISLPTGFTPENSDLEMLSNAVDSYINDFKIVDNLSDRGSLIIHLFKVSHKEPEILIFRLQQRFKVGLLQPSSVTVYEYYNPDHRCTHTYTPREDREELTQICKDNVCRCTQVLQVKVLNVTQSYYEKYEMEITKVIKLVYQRAEFNRVTALGKKLTLNLLVLDWRLLRRLPEGVESGVEVGQKRVFMSHGGCRDDLNLQQGSQYLVMGPKEDQWNIDSEKQVHLHVGEGHLGGALADACRVLQQS
ncbi:hypothetical protein NQZ68_013480 [Dissostichus eleginoides]|nr:hypothetical protein NQZ68_013480 [Dissostichus eleginoides]